MRLTKRFRSVGLVVISLLLAGLTLSAQTQKWNSEDLKNKIEYFMENPKELEACRIPTFPAS